MSTLKTESFSEKGWSIDDVENRLKQRIKELNEEIKPYNGKIRPIGLVENKIIKIMGLEEALKVINEMKGE